MAIQSATTPERISVSRYGDIFLPPHSYDGESAGEQSVQLEITSNADAQLHEIAYMRSVMSEWPMRGDDKVFELLAFDEAVLRSGIDDDYVSEILLTYPDMPAILREAAHHAPDLVVTATETDRELALSAFDEAPVEYLLALSDEEIHDILRELRYSLSDASVHQPTAELIAA